MRELIKTLIVIMFLFAVLYAIYGVLVADEYSAYLVIGPIAAGIILLLLMNWFFPEKKNPWIKERKDEDQ